MDTILGLPIHPLLVHAPIIIVPALILAAVCYAVAPSLRRRIGWAVMLLGGLAPLSTLGAWWSGHRFYDLHVDMISKAGADPSDFQKLLADHLGYGDILVWLVPALTVSVWALGYLNHRQRGRTESGPGSPAPMTRRLAMIVLAVAVVGLSGVSGWFLVQSGHSGAEVVWGQENK